MKICPITLEEHVGPSQYSTKGLQQLSKRWTELRPIPFTPAQMLQQAGSRVQRMSIQGVQPKLSAVIHSASSTFQLVDMNGKYILKPPHPQLDHLPENEHLTMRLVQAAGFETPLNGLVPLVEGQWCYFIKRFDRANRGKLPMEDMSQLIGKNRSDKYNSSIEKVAKAIVSYCTFPALELERFYHILLLAFLTGNSDMHLKNISLLTDAKGIVRLSPAYDQVNHRVAMGKADTEQLALTLRAKRNKLNREDLTHYLPQLLGLNAKVQAYVLGQVQQGLLAWPGLIARSFLPSEKKASYAQLVAQRAQVLGLTFEGSVD